MLHDTESNNRPESKYPVGGMLNAVSYTVLNLMFGLIPDISTLILPDSGYPAGYRIYGYFPRLSIVEFIVEING